MLTLPNADCSLSRKDLRKVFTRNRGEIVRLARELDVNACSVSLWLRGKFKSARLEAAIRARAAELINRNKAA